jgi:hypothetical protein
MQTLRRTVGFARSSVRRNPYLETVEGAFGADVDYAQLVKVRLGKRAENIHVRLFQRSAPR